MPMEVQEARAELELVCVKARNIRAFPGVKKLGNHRLQSFLSVCTECFSLHVADGLSSLTSFRCNLALFGKSTRRKHGAGCWLELFLVECYLSVG